MVQTSQDTANTEYRCQYIKDVYQDKVNSVIRSGFISNYLLLGWGVNPQLSFIYCDIKCLRTLKINIVF